MPGEGCRMSNIIVPLPPDHGRNRAFFRHHTQNIISHPVSAWFFAGFIACCLGVWFSSGEMFIVIPVLVLAWAFVSVAWWWAPKLSNHARIAWIIISALPLFAEGAILHGHFQPKTATSAKEPPKVDVPAKQTAALLFEWKWSRLPTAIPASGVVWTMSIISKLEFGGEPSLLSPRPGSSGDKLSWLEDQRQYGGVYRGDITNYSDYPIFNLVMAFKTEFFKPETDGSHRPGPAAETYDRPVVISKLDPKETFSFYAYSDSRMYVSVWLPKEVTYLRDNMSQREVARLLPQGEQVITLFPMTLVDQTAKSPPVLAPKDSADGPVSEPGKQDAPKSKDRSQLVSTVGKAVFRCKRPQKLDGQTPEKARAEAKQNMRAMGENFGLSVDLKDIPNGISIEITPKTNEGKLRMSAAEKYTLEVRSSGAELLVYARMQLISIMGAIADLMPVDPKSESILSETQTIERIVGVAPGACRLM